MKKIMLIVALVVTVGYAKGDVTIPEKENRPGLKEVLVLPVVGALLFPGLVIGDAQWQYYTNRGNCDTRHFIVTLVPTPKNRDDFGLSVKIPCNAWFEEN